MKTMNELSNIITDFIESSLYKDIEIVIDTNLAALELTLHELLKRPVAIDLKNTEDVWEYRDYLFNIYSVIVEHDYVDFIKRYVKNYNIFYKETVDESLHEGVLIDEELPLIDIALVGLHIASNFE